MIPIDKASLLQRPNANKKEGNCYHVDDSDFNLKFDYDKVIQCERISFQNSNISFQNLNLCGAITFRNCNISILSSQIVRNGKDEKDLIVADRNSTLIISDCQIYSKDFNGVLIKNHSFCSISNSVI
jgi:hypothetical protein